jgi:hypothetical protein
MSGVNHSSNEDDTLAAWAYALELENLQQELERQHWEKTKMKIGEMMPSKYLKKEDIGRGALVTIKGLARTNVAMDGEPVENKYVLYFNEFEKPLVLNSTNIHLCAQICGSEDTDDWIGKQLVLYTDPNVSFGGKLIGGLRVRAPKPQAAVPAPVVSPPTFDDDIPW